MKTDTRTLNKRIGARIADRRKATGLTQAQVAEAMGLSNDAISRMERGNIMPTVQRLVQLSELFDCETADFLTQSSPTLPDQIRRVADLLASLPEAERESFLGLMETMMAWHIRSKVSE